MIREVGEGLGWAAGIGSAALAVVGEMLPPSLPGAEYATQLGGIGFVLFLLWRAGERIGSAVVEHGKAAGRALLDFLDRKDEKDREALEGVRKSVDRLGEILHQSSDQSREHFRQLVELVQARETTRRRRAPASKEKP